MTSGFIRPSIGMEDVKDSQKSLDQALKAPPVGAIPDFNGYAAPIASSQTVAVHMAVLVQSEARL